MREILFRAKRIKNGEWVEGNFIFQFDHKKKESCGFITKQDQNFDKPDFNPVEIDIKTLGQFTGLCDKNGKKIFEGDICRIKYKEIRDYMGVKYDDFMEFNEVVVYNEDFGGFCFMLVDDGIKMYRPIWKNQNNEIIKIEEYEVIGNIHDNPELLEGV